ncbi:uncharacterized protein LOC143295732 [Babylonia areolata]|uniref:uncharacterized protein LOC143295732 n=1 Tax=Babylonia areolata TaxID=304850 RepID=UPI003FD553A2
MSISVIRPCHKMVCRRKKVVITGLLICFVLYGAIQVKHYQEEYSPLQELSSAESEAQRLLKFMTSYHYQCNATLHSTNISDWAICVEQDIGINPDPMVAKTAYSIGPLPDYSFEALLSRNLSVHQFIFLHEAPGQNPQALLRLNATIYHTAIVPNDPADFGRNSYDAQTVNSVMSRLGHRRVEVLKVEGVQDAARSYELLYFMVKDGLLARFLQLHVMMEIDKIDDNYLYGWYKTLYTLFTTAGFRLYHTSSSNPLCLQVTMMESCRYFMSWVRNPGPRTFVLYPPAIDGSEEFEVQRLEGLLEGREQSEDDVIPVALSPSTTLRLARPVLMTSPHPCVIFVFKYKLGHRLQQDVAALHVKCTVLMFSPLRNRRNIYDFSSFHIRGQAESETLTMSEIISRFLLTTPQTSIVHIDLGQSSWTFLSLFLDSGALQKVDQLIMVAPMFLVPSRPGRQPAQVLRQQYSELQRIMAFHMMLVEASALTHNSLSFRSARDLWRVSFVKK